MIIQIFIHLSNPNIFCAHCLNGATGAIPDQVWDCMECQVGTKIFWSPEFFDRDYGQKAGALKLVRKNIGWRSWEIHIFSEIII